MTVERVAWRGRAESVPPRIRLTRSFDERSHSYLGFALRLRGTVAGFEREFTVGIGKAAQVKHNFRVGDVVAGESARVDDPRTEPVELYRSVKLKVVERGALLEEKGPPWHGIAPELPVYRERGHRRFNLANDLSFPLSKHDSYQHASSR